MTNTSLERAAQRRVVGFEYKYSDRHGDTYGKNLLYLACHAALPAALSTDLVHLLRINFFFENTEQLPYTAEADLLLSPLCTEIGDELYEMDHEVRDILLQKLTYKYGRGRLSEVAKLLWQYDQRFAPWAKRDMLERAQQLTALSFLDPTQARLWLAQQPTDHYSIEQRVWFTAVNKEVLLAEKNFPIAVEYVQPMASEFQGATTSGEQLQITPIEQLEQLNVEVSTEEPTLDVSEILDTEDQQQIVRDKLISSRSYLKDHRNTIASIEYIIRTTMPGKISLVSLEEFGEHIVEALEYIYRSTEKWKDKRAVIFSLEKAKTPLQLAIDETRPGGKKSLIYRNISLVGKSLEEALDHWEPDRTLRTDEMGKRA